MSAPAARALLSMLKRLLSFDETDPVEALRVAQDALKLASVASAANYVYWKWAEFQENEDIHFDTVVEAMCLKLKPALDALMEDS